VKERIQSLLQFVLDKRHHQFRQDDEFNWASEFAALNLADLERATVRLERVLAAERAVILPGERIVGLRTIRKIPEIFTADEWVKIKQNHYIHELGRVCNISSDYETTIRLGLEARKL
jgi:hypothetical protein